MLSKKDREQLKAVGMSHCVIVEEGVGKRLIRGRSAFGDTLWGWWFDGEAAGDIRWSLEKANA